MNIRIALAGNPNCGKTTLFNALTGSNQFVGNWPGVTVEKKEGKLKKHKNVTIIDLPGIYSLSPYTLEEVVSRNFLLDEKPDVILNLIDGTNLERNLYLSTQLAELGIPMVIAINMMDLVKKNKDHIDIEKLSKKLSCKVVEISALKNTGIMEAANEAIEAAKNKSTPSCAHFQKEVEDTISYIEEIVGNKLIEKQKRWYAIKLFERDEEVIKKIYLSPEIKTAIEERTKNTEEKLDDDSESIITNERYSYIGELISDTYQKNSKKKLSTSDKIDRIVTNRILGLPIFAGIMFLVYWISMVAVGTPASDWTNDGVFGDGWHLFANGSKEYEEASEEYSNASSIIEGYNNYKEEHGYVPTSDFTYTTTTDEDTLETSEETASIADYKEALTTLEKYGEEEPDPSNYGVWVPGIPSLVENALDKAGAADWLKGLILDGIVAGVGSVIGFLPQMLVLFLLLAFLEACGYMARIAFVLDRIFRKFGFSGKSFIPMLVGTGCGVPGIMASRTIENERDRRMTVITTTFIPCSAKMPIIALIAGALFGGSAWIATSAYFIGMAAIVVSGLILKKSKMFAGQASPFVMELPAYHWPTVKNILRSTWERAWSFIKKAGSIILIATVVIWFTSRFGFTDVGFRLLSEEELDMSILAKVGSFIVPIFVPLGWGNWQASVATITGLIAKENVVGTMGVLYSGPEASIWANIAAAFTPLSAYSFLVFNLLCAPCFAAIGAIRREMNDGKWTWLAIAYQCGFAYAVALIIYQIGAIWAGQINIAALIVAIALLAAMVYIIAFKKPAKAGNKIPVTA